MESIRNEFERLGNKKGYIDFDDQLYVWLRYRCLQDVIDNKENSASELYNYFIEWYELNFPLKRQRTLKAFQKALLRY